MFLATVRFFNYWEAGSEDCPVVSPGWYFLVPGEDEEVWAGPFRSEEEAEEAANE
jgi:hypothetical protein